MSLRKTGTLERLTDAAIPWCVAVLTILLILENPFWTLVHLEAYEPAVTWIERVILFVFVADLLFKWHSVRHWKQFLRLYWLDLIAIFPFYLIARTWITVASLVRVGEDLGEGQRFLHEFLFLRETELASEARLLKEAELLKEARPLTSAIRTVQRFFRFLAGHDLEHTDRPSRKLRSH